MKSTNGPQRAFDTYSPSIVNSFGFGNLQANALASVGFFIQIPMSFLFSWVSDRFNLRGPTVMAGLFCHLSGYALNLGFTALTNRNIRYFGVVWTQIFGTFSHPLNIAWMSLAARDSEERALAMAMVIMGGNIAGIYGAQILRADDRPLYRRGFSINIGILAVAIGLAALRFWDDQKIRRRQKRLGEYGSESSSQNGEIKGDVAEAKNGEGIGAALAEPSRFEVEKVRL